MSGNKRPKVKQLKPIGSDLKKFDEYVLGPEDYDGIPELTDDDFARGTFHIGGLPTPRSRAWQGRFKAAPRKAKKLPAKKV
jgi:hypothetical protein